MPSMVVAPGGSARPAVPGRLLTLLVLLLTIGVIGMHSLGTTHQIPTAMPTVMPMTGPMAVPSAAPAMLLAAPDMTPARGGGRTELVAAPDRSDGGAAFLGL